MASISKILANALPKTVGYLRVSTADQDLDKNKSDILVLAHQKRLNQVEFVEEKASGKISWRKREIAKVIEDLRNGDSLIVSELSRWGAACWNAWKSCPQPCSTAFAFTPSKATGSQIKPYKVRSQLWRFLWLLPSEGFREMCSWERFCTFAREPENRKVDSEACVSIEGVRYQLDYVIAGQEVIQLQGLFDNELQVEFNQEKHGPFYPDADLIQLGTFRKPSKSATEKRADRIGDLAKSISVPRSALSGEKESITSLLKETHALHEERPPPVPFSDTDPFDFSTFKNKIDAKTARHGASVAPSLRFFLQAQ